MANKEYMTGNRVLLKINGKVVGGGQQSLTADRDFGLQDVDGLGTPFPIEHAVGKITDTITLDSYFISEQDLIKSGYVPADDTVLTAGVIDIEVIDKISKTPVVTFVGCSAASHRYTFTKHMISGENATFRALGRQ